MHKVLYILHVLVAQGLVHFAQGTVHYA